MSLSIAPLRLFCVTLLALNGGCLGEEAESIPACQLQEDGVTDCDTGYFKAKAIITGASARASECSEHLVSVGVDGDVLLENTSDSTMTIQGVSVRWSVAGRHDCYVEDLDPGLWVHAYTVVRKEPELRDVFDLPADVEPGSSRYVTAFVSGDPEAFEKSCIGDVSELDMGSFWAELRFVAVVHLTIGKVDADVEVSGHGEVDYSDCCFDDWECDFI
jgi:hypothetical protein